MMIRERGSNPSSNHRQLRPLPSKPTRATYTPGVRTLRKIPPQIPRISGKRDRPARDPMQAMTYEGANSAIVASGKGPPG